MSTEARAQPQATLSGDMVGQEDMVQRALADPRAFREIYQVADHGALLVEQRPGDDRRGCP